VFCAKRRTRRRPSLLHCGNDHAAKGITATLIRDVGFDPVDAGPLTTARFLKPFALAMAQLAYEGTADRYPGDVAGMVLIDTYSEGEGDVPSAVISALDPRPEAEPNSIARLPADLRAARDWARSLPRQQDISDPDEPDAAIAASGTRNTLPGIRTRLILAAKCSSPRGPATRGLSSDGVRAVALL